MRIGELARRTGLSVHAIRWYEGQRLIPGVRRTAAGHREYADWHEAWLALLDGFVPPPEELRRAWTARDAL